MTTGDRRAVGAVLGAVLVTLVLVTPTMAGLVAVDVSAAITVALGGLIALVAWHGCRGAAGRGAGVEARVWRHLANGSACWALGAVPYLAFLAIGGDMRSPAAWTQIGFLAAYPFWYRAFWLLRQPVLAESRAARLESWGVEIAALGLIAAVVAGAIWHDSLPASENIALLVPVALDLLLLAALYNAMRRSTLTHASALVWCAYAFGALAATDALISYLVTSAHILVLGLVLCGYWVALCLLGIASGRPLRVTEAKALLGPSRTILAAVTLALCAPAGALVPPALQPLVWATGAVVFWRLVAMLRARNDSDTDPLTGMLESRSFARHVGGVVQAANADQPAVLVAVDLDGFATWNARNGYGKGDALLAEVAGRLEASDLPVGVWSRLGADRFAWIGVPTDAGCARDIAERAQAAAENNSGGLMARAGVVLVPTDATIVSNVLAAAEEALGAARAGGRRVVAFDRGRLDGVDYVGGYTASLAERRRAVMELLQAPASLDIVLQPVVDLNTGRAVGFEALSRFRAEPMRPPDRWIAEAHAVGLGIQVEVECLRRAAERRHERPAGTFLSINASPAALLTPELEEALGPGPLDWLVIEITEHDEVADYGALAACLSNLRARGAMVAIDDTGAGHSSLRHVTEIRPEFVKLDRFLVQDANLHLGKVAILRSMKTLERGLRGDPDGELDEGDEGMPGRLIAEGVESLEELEVLRAVGVSLAQGYLFARPSAGFVTEGLMPVTALG